MSRYPCPWRGCPDVRIRPEIRDRHAAELHFLCTCGRNFTARGIVAHRAGVVRHGSPHPPFPALPVGRTEAARRARAALQLNKVA